MLLLGGDGKTHAKRVAVGKNICWEVTKGKAGTHDGITGEVEFNYGLTDDLQGIVNKAFGGENGTALRAPRTMTLKSIGAMDRPKPSCSPRTRSSQCRDGRPGRESAQNTGYA